MDIEKMWVKFDELEIECWCSKERKKCPKEKKPECKLYLVKFIEIMDEAKHDDRMKIIRETATKLERDIVKKFKKETNKFKKEIDRSISKFKV